MESRLQGQGQIKLPPVKRREEKLNHRPPELKMEGKGKTHDAFALFYAMIVCDAFATYFIKFPKHISGFFIKLP